jgi:hypothetical protein
MRGGFRRSRLEMTFVRRPLKRVHSDALVVVRVADPPSSITRNTVHRLGNVLDRPRAGSGVSALSILRSSPG